MRLLLFAVSLFSASAIAQVTPAISLTVDGGSNLPLNGTTTKVTVGFAGGPVPAQVQLSRDGNVPFATWPPSGFFTLTPSGNSLTGTWCISSGCWGGVGGTHVLTVTATYAGGLIFTVSIPLNVADGQIAVPPVTAGAGPNYPASMFWNGLNWTPFFRVSPP